MMDWAKLLSTKRLGRTKVDEQAVRTAFTRDYDRIIFSSAFRRLQDKTQVFPLAKSDYVRTRLTHSLEVASVGRSLGMLATDIIHRKESSLKTVFAPQDVGAVVSTACLAHDIGNPPFGHAGESAIQEWFESSKLFPKSQMSEAEKSDLVKFEGNAQGLRTLCTLQNYPQPGGLQLTCAVLGTFTKYPRASQVDSSQMQGISAKKFGFMQSEAALFEELATELGLIKKPGAALAWHRHPLAFLVEAADDICYHVMDVEDGFKAGVIPLEEIESLHRPWLSEKQITQGTKIAHTQRRAEYFRAVTVNAMVHEAIDVFGSNYNEIMSGAFDDELAARMQHSKEFSAFKNLAKKKVYCMRPVIEIEACGFEVIGGLLDAFVGAIETNVKKNPHGQARSRTLLNLLPAGVDWSMASTPYERILVTTDFVSGMTDSFAVELYQRIRGIALP